MIYIIKKMYKAFGDYIDNYSDLRGINPFFQSTEITNIYPAIYDVIGSLTLGGQIHKEVRRFLQPYLRPGIKIVDIAKLIELKTEELTINIPNSKPINKGIGFPASLSINECAAHYHPSSNSDQVLKESDIIKIDFGVEVNQWIVDSAFSVYFDHKFDNLANAVKDATYTGLKNIGVDVSISEWGAEIQEVMESYEIKLDGKVHPIRTIKNLGGHNITRGIIHGGMFLPTVDMKEYFSIDYKFKEGVYAVETFGSTGDNYAEQKIYSKNFDPTLYRINLENFTTKKDKTLSIESNNLIENIYTQFNTLPFTDRYIENDFLNYKNNIKLLVDNELVHHYPPLCVNSGDYTAQYEHTIYISDNKKIVFSSSEDY